MNPRLVSPAAVFCAAIVSLLNAGVLSAQQWSDLVIRESLDTKAIPRPAQVAVTVPKDSGASIMINAAARFDVSQIRSLGFQEEALLELGPFIEIQRNTEAEEEQDLLRLGASVDWQLRAIVDTVNPGASAAATWTPNLLAQLNYKRDGIKDTEGVQAEVAGTVLLRPRGKRASYFYLPNVRTDLWFVDVQYMPYTGFGWETSVPPDGGDVASALRWIGRLEFAVFPWPTKLRDHVQITAEHNRLLEILDPIPGTDRDHSQFKVTLDLLFLRDTDDDRTVGLGVTYVRGEDPSRGFEDQELTRIGFKFQF